jgi:hypothetical protein
MARGVPVAYVAEPPAGSPWLLYAPKERLRSLPHGCLAIAHFPEAWELPRREPDDSIGRVGGLAVISPQRLDSPDSNATIGFDLIANAFYFLSSWPERAARDKTQTRGLYSRSIYGRCGVPQDIVDLYLDYVVKALEGVCQQVNVSPWPDRVWPANTEYGVVLSHDIDFIPHGLVDTAKQGLKSILRHLIRERDPMDALRVAAGLLAAVATGRDAYGCVPEIMAEEKRLGVNASFQVAVGHRHPYDVNYHVEERDVQGYLRRILDEGFELCLHGSYRSTELPEWYIGEVELLTRTLGRPLGSRQHFLSFDYDTLFAAQERAGIQYDMSMGFPDRAGPRAGFSYPYFPYCIADDRPYDVVEISLFLMDVTLRSYMGLKGEGAWQFVETELTKLKNKRGLVSVVWHPIVFGGARDPGYDALFWRLVDHVRSTNGLATDGRAVNEYWRAIAKDYPSFM